MHINLSYAWGTSDHSRVFNPKLIECLKLLSRLLNFSTISVELTSSHNGIITFSRQIAWEDGTFKIAPYYPNVPKIELKELTPYHSWELIDDLKDLHQELEGVISSEDISFHIYPQLFSARIFEKVTSKNSKFDFYIGDDLHQFHFAELNNEYWFFPSNNIEASNLPFQMAIWYTQNTIEVDLKINWNVFAIEDTPSNKALKEVLISFIERGWKFDKDSDIQLAKTERPEISEQTIDGFIKVNLLIEDMM